MHSHLPQAISATFISLIPKNHNPQGLNDYRQICLIGSIYRIISKLLIEIMKGVMDKLVSLSQSMFVSKKGLLDGVLVLNELVDFARRNKKGLFLFKVDFKKEFDSVSWEYLLYVLKRMNFGNKWIQWIRVCVCSNSLYVLINGSPIVNFQANKGLCQWDSLSPLLFILAAEGIPCLMKNVCSRTCFQSFSLSDHLQFDFLQFADDTILVWQLSWENIWSIKAMLREFDLVFGLSVNFNKRRIIEFNVNQFFFEGSLKLPGPRY